MQNQADRADLETEEGNLLEHEIAWLDLVADMTEINHLAAADSKYNELTAPRPDDDACRIGSRARTIGEHFAIEAPLLERRPAERCEPAADPHRGR